MTPKTSRLVLITSAFLVSLVLCFTVVMLLSQRTNTTVAASAIGGPFSLIDQDGKTVTEAALKGKPHLVFFGFTHCPDICPTTLFDVSEIFRALGKDGDKVGAFFVTVDPERDTPKAMKDYLGSFDPRLRGLSGDTQAIQAMEKSYRVYAKKVPTSGGDYTMDHTAIVYLMDRNGQFVRPFDLKRKPEESAAELRKYF
jgi:protein SCO1/2